METKHNPSDHQGHDEFEKVSSALKEAINAKKIHGVFLCVEYEDHKGHDNIGGMWADGDFVASLKAWANEIVTNDQFYSMKLLRRHLKWLRNREPKMNMRNQFNY